LHAFFILAASLIVSHYPRFLLAQMAASLILVLSNSALVAIMGLQIAKEYIWGAMHGMDCDEDGVVNVY
jgi:hypothetical protein